MQTAINYLTLNSTRHPNKCCPYTSPHNPHNTLGILKNPRLGSKQHDNVNHLVHSRAGLKLTCVWSPAPNHYAVLSQHPAPSDFSEEDSFSIVLQVDLPQFQSELTFFILKEHRETCSKGNTRFAFGRHGNRGLNGNYMAQ